MLCVTWNPWNSVERTTSDTRILSLMSKRMADLQRIRSLQDQLQQSEAKTRDAEAKAREVEMKLREKDINDVMKQTEDDYLQLWLQMRR